MATFSLYNDFTTPNGKVNIIDLGEGYQNGNYEMLINDYRADLWWNPKRKNSKETSSFHPSGIFIQEER